MPYRPIRHGLVCIFVVLMSSIQSVSAVGSTDPSMKALLRKEINSKLSSLSSPYVEERSTLLLDRLIQLKQFRESHITSAYLSMPQGEVNTYEIIKEAFQQQKRVFVPKIVGKKPQDMFMFELSSFDAMNSFNRNQWGIPEPDLAMASSSADGTYQGLIDLVLLPGVAFDAKCGRLGHGKGYYGSCDSCVLMNTFVLPFR